MMEWHKLLSDSRLKNPTAESQEGRSRFQQDLDRIVFSAEFRRLAHKTQVHPLAENDHIHTRLTHSIEVASVGRSLGTIVGTHVANSLADPTISADMFGYIIQAACLAHDIGNPPFGHSGEQTISDWFDRYFENPESRKFGLTSRQQADFRQFDGNAQGFRILTQLEDHKWIGGLQLTHAVLGTFTKYPYSSSDRTIKNAEYIGWKKIGLLESEEEHFLAVATSLGLPDEGDGWRRHPLAFLLESADDICYSIMDIEDGFEMGYIDFSTAKGILEPMARLEFSSASNLTEREMISKWRASAIYNLVAEAADKFIENEERLLMGIFNEELINCTSYAQGIADAKETAKRKIYWSERKTQREIAGGEILCGLLEFFVPVAARLAEQRWQIEKLSKRDQGLCRMIMPDPFAGVASHYDALLRITDFIAGMTDRYALDLYRKLKGISIG